MNSTDYQQLKLLADAIDAGDKVLADTIFDNFKRPVALPAANKLYDYLEAKYLKQFKQDIQSISPAYKAADVTCGRFLSYPDETGKRQAEGGRRLGGRLKTSRPNKPLVTIITAVYDNEQTFQRCISSVKAQTYSNVEYIVVDGASPQGTLDILRSNENFIDYYISEPDQGIYSAMNKGIRLARGDYICLLNSDDFYEPSFLEKAIALADAEAADIVYTDYHHGENHMSAQPMGPGILLGHLNVCHNTFLTSRECYNRIGLYDEECRIVSDAVWMRKAYQHGSRFACLSESMYTLTEGGLSSGNTEARRELFISEVVKSYRMVFPQLNEKDAEEIYLFRFNKGRTAKLIQIAKKYVSGDKNLYYALRAYVQYCFGVRKNFQLHHTESDSLFPLFIELCEILGADKKCIHINTKQGLFADILAQIDNITSGRKCGSQKTILHFVTVFSAPPETFIYDLLVRMEASEQFDNFVLYEHEKLPEKRPFRKKLRVAWQDYRVPLAEQIYKYYIEAIQPDIVIAHFAINEHRFNNRIAPLNLKIPTIVMTHGIDVFQLKRTTEYSQYVLNVLAQRHDVAFTAVSKYLRGELINAGVEPCKITYIPNTVNDRFFAHRKTTDFFDYSRPLRLLCVGRLIDWKGHSYLLDALAQFSERCTDQVHLTIVYGNGGDKLKDLQAQSERLGIAQNVTFEAFVDFNINPDFFSNFDLYVHPSTYSSSDLHNSETFGVAVLEAIAAGLPVIATDAGGLSEVIGKDGYHSRIVRHSDAEAIFIALQEVYEDGEAFSDNLIYAEKRLALFSEKRQIDSLTELIETVTSQPIKVALFSTSTIQGAGYAAYRIHKGLRKTSVKSQMFTTVRNHERDSDVTVLHHPSGDNHNWAALQIPPKPGLTISTFDKTHIPSEKLLHMVEPFDIISLHWHARFLSVENIAALTHSDKPIVMTIRDMMPITGGCHFFHGCNKWRDDCDDCPQLAGAQKSRPANVLQAKREGYDFSNLTIVTISNHTRNIIKKVPYFNTCRIETIPNSIETDIFRPYNKIEARREFGLPLDRKIIGYVPSFSSEVKGYRELIEVFNLLNSKTLGFSPFIMLVGNETPATEKIVFDKKALGYISDNKKLARAYSAADVVVVPSLEETFSNTTAESISCGVPVVGFHTGAIPDLAINGKTGYTCEVGDVVAFAEGITKVLTGPYLSANCRAHAEETLSFMKQAYRYENLFREIQKNNSCENLTQKTAQLLERTLVQRRGMLKC